MTDSIKISNQEIITLIKLNPDYGVIKILKKWKSQGRRKDYHGILGLIASQLGFSLLMRPSKNKWIPYFDYKPNNLLQEIEGTYSLSEALPFGKCQKKLTQEAIYRLMRMHNIEDILS